VKPHSDAIHSQALRCDPPNGLGAALAVMALWGGSLVALLARASQMRSAFAVVPVMLVQTFLYTGLFITAHDALHGSVCARHPRLNDAVGALCATLYAMFSFRRLRVEHGKHHAHPGSAGDPDFHDGRHPGFWRWYARFFASYFRWTQVAGMTVVFQVLDHGLAIPARSLVLFWVAPSLLSTLQLFYFGTYLPHREPPGGHADSHHARSSEFSALTSFLTCYHFGYHWEHHEHPHVPWWKLPAVRRAAASTG
jgi:beta-carotene ketolase (CrtW type)